MDLLIATDIKLLVDQILNQLPFDHIEKNRIICMRSFKATSRARARIWSFPKIWQLALKKPPHYVIEVLSQHFDKLSFDDKVRVLIHELMHIPQNFSGALVPHRGIHKRINHHTVENMFLIYKQNTRI